MRLIAVVLALSLPSVANALPDGVKLGMAAFELRLSNWNQLNPYTLRLYQPNSPLGTARAIAHPDVGVCYLEEATGLSDLDSLEEAEKFQRDYKAIFSELSLRHGTPKESFTHRQYLDRSAPYEYSSLLRENSGSSGHFRRCIIGAKAMETAFGWSSDMRLTAAGNRSA